MKFFIATIVLLCGNPLFAAKLPWITMSKDQQGFVQDQSDVPFKPWGFNYDRDEEGRLLEDYWEAEWPKVVRDFRTMKELGANVVRIHLQLGRFLESADRPNVGALNRLRNLVELAEEIGIYLDVTGLGCYHKADVPAWYDKLSESDRWAAQGQFWQSVATVCSDSPAIFCYDLMNEPVVPGGKRADGDWLGPAFGGKHYVQVITLDQDGRQRPDIARKWIRQLTGAIRAKDKRHLVTVGLVDWSLDRPGLTSGFVPDKIAKDLDFLCVHLYPEAGKIDVAVKTLEAFSCGRPVVVEETFPLKCSLGEFNQFIDQTEKHAAGVIGFYWGKPPEQLRDSTSIADAITLKWLEIFQTKANAGR